MRSYYTPISKSDHIFIKKDGRANPHFVLLQEQWIPLGRLRVLAKLLCNFLLIKVLD